MYMLNPGTERRDPVGRSTHEHRLADHQAAIKRRIKTHLSDCRICKVGDVSLRGHDTVQGCAWYHALIGELVTVGQQIRGLE